MKKYCAFILILVSIIGIFAIIIIPSGHEVQELRASYYNYKPKFSATSATSIINRYTVSKMNVKQKASGVNSGEIHYQKAVVKKLKLEKNQEKKRKIKLKRKRELKKKRSARYAVYDYREGKWYKMNGKLQDYLRNLCIKKGILDEFPIILCQIYVESGYQADLVSETNDYGIAQINVCNHEELRKKLGIRNFLNPYESVKCNVYFMGSYFKDYTTSQALSKYNTGRPYNSTEYSRKVMRMYNNGKGVKML